MTNRPVVGAQPRLPPPLSRSRWWTEPVPAERLAAVRIGTGAVLLADVLFTYLRYAPDLFGPGSLGAPQLFGGSDPHLLWPWSPLAGIDSTWEWRTILIVWGACAGMLALGLFSKAAAGGALLLALCLSNANPYVINSGDMVRHALLLYLTLSPSGAAWALRRRPRSRSNRPYVSPWPLRLMFVQLCVIYFVNGIAKLQSPLWREGEAIYYVLASLDWSLLGPFVPYEMTRALTWTTLVWEIGFPVLVTVPLTRKPALWFGVAFHVGTSIAMRVGLFGLYMMCLYLPFVAWERLSESPRPGGGTGA